MDKRNKIIDFGKMKQNLTGKGTTILVVVGLIGILLIFLSGFLPTQASKSTSSVAQTSSNTSLYASQTEQKLKSILGRISGVGRVDVMVTVGSGVEYVYEEDQKSTADSTKSTQNDGSIQTQDNSNQELNPVVIDNGSGGQSPVVKKQIEPQITGVVVVCDGGGDPVIVEDITDTVSTALDLPANHISVSKMSA